MADVDDLDELLGLDEPAPSKPEPTPPPAQASPEVSADLDDILGSTGTPESPVQDDEPDAPTAVPESPIQDDVDGSAGGDDSMPVQDDPDLASIPGPKAEPAKRTRRTLAQVEEETRAEMEADFARRRADMEAEIRASIQAEQVAQPNSVVDMVPPQVVTQERVVDETTAVRTVTPEQALPIPESAIESAAPDAVPTVVVPSEAAEQAPVNEVVNPVAAPPAETEEQAFERMLQKRLEGTSDPDTGRPLPDSQLTEQQVSARRAQDQIAREQGRSFSSREDQYEAASSDDMLMIHILNDGLVINGKPCYRGEVFNFDRNGTAYKQTLDRNGESFLELAASAGAQMNRWGEVKFGIGPWPGRTASDLTLRDAPQELTREEKVQWLADMQANEKMDSRRAHAAPVMH